MHVGGNSDNLLAILTATATTRLLQTLDNKRSIEMCSTEMCLTRVYYVGENVCDNGFQDQFQANNIFINYHQNANWC